MKRYFICTWTIIMIFFTLSCGRDKSRSGHVEIRLFSENNTKGNDLYRGENIRNVQIETINGWKYIKPISTEHNNKYNIVTVNESGFGLRWNYDNVKEKDGLDGSFEGDRIEYYETRLHATTSKRDFFIKMSREEVKAEIRRYSYYTGSSSDYNVIGIVTGEKLGLTRDEFSVVKVQFEKGITNVRLYLPYIVNISKESNIDSPYSEEPEFFKEITNNNSNEYFEVLSKNIIIKDLFGMNKDSKVLFRTNDGIERVIKLELEKNTSYIIKLTNVTPYYEIIIK